ncbi:hypothetical protein BpHYR1_045568 [Brachionus plicatilis]|uniref:Uncharacterized protein n=1 Tax=Brachionus plicatilis TaxID=10195 RepID=A0A3M7QLU3_BRAPC|nr:hypothetical protein BpHYR1_045568 [Brachionus plicatilis]
MCVNMLEKVEDLIFNQLDSYQNGSKLSECLPEVNYTIFQYSKIIIFSTTMKYKQKTCPLMLLNKNLFAMVKYLEMSGSLKSINSNALTKFNQLETLRLDLKNFVEFLSQNTSWLFALLNQNRQKITLHYPSLNYYTYPDEDFYLFKDYPLNTSVESVIPF